MLKRKPIIISIKILIKNELDGFAKFDVIGHLKWGGKIQFSNHLILNITF